MKSGARAFTLTELLVVVAIISMLVTVLTPSFLRVADMARESSCLSNLRILSEAALAYVTRFKGLLPKNDSEAADYPDLDEFNRLPGEDSTLKWWCNKVYNYGEKRAEVFICPSDPGRASDADAVQCGYGFNNTLTDPAPGDEAKSIFEIEDTERTAIIGHCSNYTREPAIMEEMVLGDGGDLSGTDWPIGHLARYDWEAKQKVGRCGFVMASGKVDIRTFSEAVRLKNSDGKILLFRKSK